MRYLIIFFIFISFNVKAEIVSLNCKWLWGEILDYGNNVELKRSKQNNKTIQLDLKKKRVLEGFPIPDKNIRWSETEIVGRSDWNTNTHSTTYILNRYSGEYIEENHIKSWKKMFKDVYGCSVTKKKF